MNNKDVNDQIDLESKLFGLENENKELMKQVCKLKHAKTKITKIKHNNRNAGRKTKFSEEQKKSIKKYRMEGGTYKSIANDFNCSVGVVHKLINEPNELNEEGDNVMDKRKNIFDAHELYNLTCAQYSATTLEEETGVGSDWSEFAGNLEEKFNTLSENEQEKLDKLLICVAKTEANKINRLEELDENDFVEVDDFWEERKELQRDITNGALNLLNAYWCEK